jgi:glycosyltransferase involved in cell wall biosynthesis
MKKKAVLVTTRFPWPLTNGFASKNYWLIKGLHDEFEIDLFVIQFGAVSDSDQSMVTPFCNSINIYQPTTLDIIVGLFNSILFDLPMQIGLFYSQQAKLKIRNNIKFYDVAICSVVRAAQYLANFAGPIVYDLGDSLGQVYLRDACKLNGLKKIIYREEGRRMIGYEKGIANSGGQVIFFNPTEAQFFQSPHVSSVPHGVNPLLLAPVQSDARCNDGVVIFGKMNFEPNVNAVHWFSENVLPLLPDSIFLYVLGVSPGPTILKLAATNPRVKVLGFIENPYPLIRGAIASICPVQIGGGIQNKAIESLAIGALTIVSPLAAIPMVDIDSSGLIVCDMPASWAEKIIEITKTPELFESKRDLGPAYVRKHFSWDVYAKAIKDRLKIN